MDTTCWSFETYTALSDYTQTCYLPQGEYTLVCSDSYGDGWNGAKITFEGVTYCDNFDQGSEMQVQVIITGGWGIPYSGNENAGKRRCFWCAFMSQAF